MTAKTNAMLREQTQKLKSVSDVLTKEITQYDEELSTLQQTISRCDIELSLIHDAFSLKFGNLTVNQRNQALEAMANISEIENLKEVLQREESQVRWLNNEVSRLTGLIPTKMLEDVDLDILENKKKQLEDKFDSLKQRNAKKEKNIHTIEKKMENIMTDLEKLNDELKIKEQETNEVNKIVELAEKLAAENTQLADVFKKENQKMHEIQDNLSKANTEISQMEKYISENAVNITESAKYQDNLAEIYNKVDKANKPLVELKEKYESFNSQTVSLHGSMSNQLDDITVLIEKVKELMV